MLAGSSHAHKVNFCKFTNETRNAFEDASQYSGLPTICVINGTAAGGGYELALAADHIILVDDGSASVALPEVPLLAVLPGTGGLTRVTDKRKVRRDRADVFCTTEEGVKGKRAVEWRLVDETVPSTRLETVVAERAREFAEKSPRSANGAGISLEPLETAKGARTPSITNMCRSPSTGPSASRPSRSRLPTPLRPRRAEEMVALGASFWPLQLARELDDAILDIRNNEFDVAAILFKSSGAIEKVLAFDAFLDQHREHWLAREIRLLWKRVLKRLDMTSRTIVALVEPGSCFAGTLAEIVFAADRSYMFIGEREGDNRAPARIGLGECNFGSYPMANGLTRLQSRFLADPEDVERARKKLGELIDAEEAQELGLVTFALDDIDWDDEIRDLPRGTPQLLARQPHGSRSQFAFRRAGNDGKQDFREADRLAELDLSAPERRRRGRGTASLRHRPEAGVRSEAGVEGASSE